MGVVVPKNLLLVLLCHLLLPEAHSKCPKSYACRNFSIEFPFTKSSDPDCGLFMVDNCDSEFGHPAIYKGGTDTSPSPYLIMGKPSSNKFLIHQDTLQAILELPQCLTFYNLSLLHSPSVAFTFSPNITFFTCYNQTPNQSIPEYFQSYHRKVCQFSTMYYKIPATHHHAPAIPGNCSLNQLPMKPHEKSTDLLELLTPNFTLEWNVSQQCYDCYDEGGRCASDNQQRFYCRTEQISCMAPVLVSFLLFFFSFHLLPLSANSDCLPSLPCGYVNLEFPFTVASSPGCGLITVDGCDLDPPYPTINLGSGIRGYNMLGKDSTNEISVIDIQLEAQLRNRSCFSSTNLSMIQSPSISFSFTPNLTFFSCDLEFANKSMLEKRFENYRKIDCLSTFYYRIPTTNDSAFEEKDVPRGCSLVQLPMKTSSRDSDDLFGVLSANFTLEWSVSQQCLSCYQGGGQCLTDNENQFYCGGKGNTRLKKILFIVGMTIASLASTLMIIIVFIRRKRATERREHDRDIELFLENNGNLAPMRYKYSSIKKMTKSFTEILGRGGFGSVYKGQLPDGHLMAVKILNESDGNGEDFMNEVASISRTSHINIVSLLGFCFEGSRRALIYEFMPNGSLEKFIGNNASSSTEFGLKWDKMFEIVLGIARGLEYLHQGCSTRILHLDIKPQNILLDKDLNPKISDFGLAKLCPNRSSIVSMLVARGTIGYIAPEVFSRNFGEVSYKSDVYSYGMLVLEMVGGRRTIDREDVEIYFPHIYKQLEENADSDSDLVGTMHEDENQVEKRTLMIVGLWCVQTNPKDRPSMTKVVEMLEGKLGSLEVPPKPYLYSPPRSAPTFSSFESF